MIAYTAFPRLVTEARVIAQTAERQAQERAQTGPYKRVSLAEVDARGPPLLKKDACALDSLAAERAEKSWNQAVHQLEIRRQRGSRLVRVVEDLLAIVLGMENGSGAPV